MARPQSRPPAPDPAVTSSDGEQQVTKHLRVMTLSGKGGVGKTFAALQLLRAYEILGRKPKKFEVERPNGRKLTAVLKTEGLDGEVTYVPLPSPAQLSEDPSLQAKAYAQVLWALRQTDQDILIDCAADATGAVLEAAELAEHGDMSHGGDGIMLLIVAKVGDATSMAFAEEAATRARKIWPKANLVGVITHVSGEAGRDDAERLKTSVNSLVSVDLLAAPSMLKLYAADNIPTSTIAEMSISELYALLKTELGMTEDSVAIERGRLRKWKLTTEKRMSDLLRDALGMGEATDAAAAGPQKRAGAS